MIDKFPRIYGFTAHRLARTSVNNGRLEFFNTPIWELDVIEELADRFYNDTDKISAIVTSSSLLTMERYLQNNGIQLNIKFNK